MTRDYLQPDFYHFNSDSITLVDWVHQLGFEFESVLDLGSGCGVIGLELAQRRHLKKIIFVESQIDYRLSFEANIANFLPQETQFEVYWTSFAQLQLTSKVDLIISNPPYYLPGHGQFSRSLQRMIARSFIQDSWSDIFSLVEKGLGPGGRAFFIIKSHKLILDTVYRLITPFELGIILHPLSGATILEVFRLDKN